MLSKLIFSKSYSLRFTTKHPRLNPTRLGHAAAAVRRKPVASGALTRTRIRPACRPWAPARRRVRRLGPSRTSPCRRERGASDAPTRTGSVCRPPGRPSRSDGRPRPTGNRPESSGAARRGPGKMLLSSSRVDSGPAVPSRNRGRAVAKPVRRLDSDRCGPPSPAPVPAVSPSLSRPDSERVGCSGPGRSGSLVGIVGY